MIEQKQQKQKNRKLSFVNEEQSVISKSTEILTVDQAAEDKYPVTGVVERVTELFLKKNFHLALCQSTSQPKAIQLFTP